MRSYCVEEQWTNDNFVPTFKEYMIKALATGTYRFLTVVDFIGMEKLAGEREYQWLMTNPKIVEAANLHGRLINDMRSRKVCATAIYIIYSN